MCVRPPADPVKPIQRCGPIIQGDRVGRFLTGHKRTVAGTVSGCRVWTTTEALTEPTGMSVRLRTRIRPTTTCRDTSMTLPSLVTWFSSIGACSEI